MKYKRILSLILSVLMTCSIGAITDGTALDLSVAAEVLDKDLTDHVPAGKAVNLMEQDITASRTFGTSIGRNSRLVEFDPDTSKWSDEAAYYSAVWLSAEDNITDAGLLGYYGIVSRAVKFTGGKTYLVSMPIRKTAGENVQIDAAITNEKESGLVCSQGGPVTLTDSFESYTFIINTPENADYSTTSNLVIGFPAGTPDGARIEIYTGSADGIYVGEEIAYDITAELVSGMSTTSPGTELEVKAQVVNQLGESGSLDGSISWYAMNKDKTEEVSGFTFTDGTDGKTKVEISDSVLEGDYALVAVSDAYDGFVKTLYITIEEEKKPVEPPKAELPDNTQDYIPGALPENIMNIDETASRTFSVDAGRNTAEINQELGTTWYNDSKIYGPVILETLANINNAGSNGYWGLVSKVVKFEPGKTYIITMPIKKTAGDNVRIGAAITNGTSAGLAYSDEYTLTEEYQKCTFVITTPKNADYSSDCSLIIGFPEGTPAGAKVYIDNSGPDNIYVSEESAYDINAELVSKKSDVCVKSDVIVKAEIVNQGGVKCNSEQSFAWFAMNKEKTQEAEGFSFTDNGDGTTTVHIGSEVEVGEYALVAVSNEDNKFLKTVMITVNEEQIADIETADGYKIIMSALSETDNMTVGSELELQAAVVDAQSGEIANCPQEFNWYILNEYRNVLVDLIKLDVNDAKNGATVKTYEFSKAGVYYVIAEQTIGDTVLRTSCEITVNTPNFFDYAKENLSGMTKEELSYKIADYAKVLNADFIGAESFSAETAAQIMINDLPETINSEEELSKLVKRSIALSLYAVNPQNLSLAATDGSFVYKDELLLSEIDSDSVTLFKVFEQYINELGKNNIQKEIKNGNFKSFAEFKTAFAKSTMVNAIAYPSVGGTGYISEILTEPNARLADINIAKYLASNNKEEYNAALARNLYTLSELASKIENYQVPQVISPGGTPSGIKTPASSRQEYTGVISSDKENMKFIDVAESHWAYADIYHLLQRNIIAGVSENEFKPEDFITREQFVKIICTAYGYAGSEGESAYRDVPENAWYAPYVKTLTQKGIISGIADGIFGVGTPIKRQDMCTIVYRIMHNEGESTSAPDFTDNNDIDSYAIDAVGYLSAYNIINGFEDGSFRPQEYCTRAQASTIICRILSIKGGE